MIAFPELRQLEVVEEFRWDPTQPDHEQPADRFSRLACLNYGDDGPQNWAAARAMLSGSGDAGFMRMTSVMAWPRAHPGKPSSKSA